MQLRKYLVWSISGSFPYHQHYVQYYFPPLQPGSEGVWEFPSPGNLESFRIEEHSQPVLDFRREQERIHSKGLCHKISLPIFYFKFFSFTVTLTLTLVHVVYLNDIRLLYLFLTSIIIDEKTCQLAFYQQWAVTSSVFQKGWHQLFSYLRMRSVETRRAGTSGFLII